MPCSAAHGASLLAAPRLERDGCVIAVLRGELDLASAPALREEILGLLRPGASRLIIDLSAAGYADASGVAVLVGSGRRAGLLGGWLRLASPAPEVARVLSATGVNRHLDTFPTVEAAITGHRPDNGTAAARAGIPARAVRTWPARTVGVPAPHSASTGELRAAVTALLANADAWRDADPRRRFVPAFRALALAHAGTSHAALTQAAHSLLAVLGREPLTPSPEVAATASRLRRLLHPDNRPATS
jgi:anti-anti-sigma factor